MKVHTSDFKNQIKKLGREINAKVIFTIDNVETELGAEDLNSVVLSFEGSLLKSVMKKVEIKTATEIPIDTELNVQFALKTDRYYETSDTTYQNNKDYYIYSNNKYILLVKGTDYIVGDNITGTVYNFEEYEWLDFGNYIVYSIEKEEDKRTYRIVCYDKLLYSMKKYEGINVEYPTTVRTYINALCTQIGLTFKNNEDEFANYDKAINSDLYLGQDLTYRNVLDELAQVTGSIICLDDEDKLEIRYPSIINETFDEEYLKAIDVEFGEKYGPINSVVLSRAAESDNIYIRDEESITENGLCEIKIKDNQIMNFNNRDEFLEDLLEVLDGIEFYINDFKSTGITYLELGDYYNVTVGEKNYKCLMLNDDIEVRSGLVETIYTDKLEQSQTEYTKSDTTDNRINQTWILANKQEGYIEALTTKVSSIEDVANNTYTKEQINDLIQNAETGITNKFITNGGNNIFRNTGLWFKDTTSIKYLYPSNDIFPSDDLYLLAEPNYEYWDGVVSKIKEEKAANMSALLLKSGTLSQKQQVRNGKYVVSFKYKKLIPQADVKVSINGNDFNLTETTDTEIVYAFEVNSLYIDFFVRTNLDDSCIIYDLMGNPGEEKAEYSQHPDETTTDTVNISKGITIESSDTNTTFKADSDGIRIYNNNDLQNQITDFTDTGITTKKIIVEDEMKILDLYFQIVGRNTWITKL